MVYNKKYYSLHREEIRAKYTVRSKQKKRRVLMLAELLRIHGHQEQEPVLPIPTPTAKPVKRAPPSKVAPYVFTIDHKPVWVFF
jgi:hypothetical protein